MVDENRVEGATKNFGGKVQDAVGGLTGDADLQARGKANQAIGTAQNTFGSAIDEVRDLAGTLAERTKTAPLTALGLALAIGYLVRAVTHVSRR